MVLQTLVEGMVLEAHISSENVTDPSPVHLVELYSQYGSQVSVCVCVRLFYVFTYPSPPLLQTPIFVNRELVDQGVAVWKEDSF